MIALLASMLCSVPGNARTANKPLKKFLSMIAPGETKPEMSAADSAFAERYNVIFGRVASKKEDAQDVTRLKHRNYEISLEMDKLYGTEWRKEVSPYVLGLRSNPANKDDIRVLRVLPRCGNVFELTAADTAFMKKYNVEYLIMEWPAKGSGYMIYYQNDLKTYKELDELYGTEWRNEVNPYVLELKTYIKDIANKKSKSDIGFYTMWLESVRTKKGCL